ncbi:MAG: hypothetical protein K0Q81_611, partial [Paenibacillus sp.]|nr:hypothetical protein [Paenibacillus sp.]
MEELTMSRKLHMPKLTVQQSKEEFEQRRTGLLEQLAGRDLPDIYGGWAIANLSLNRKSAEANIRLQRAALWFENPHPHGRDLRGECDFVAMKLCRAYLEFGHDSGSLDSFTMERIKAFFLIRDFQSMYDSENHHLLFHTSRYLMAHALRQERFVAYGCDGAELEEIDRDWLEQFIRFRARRGWGEFDSTCYFGPEWECLTTLYDFAPDTKLKRMAGMMLDVLLTDLVLESLNGMCGGAHGRIYSAHAHNYAKDSVYPLMYLYFGNVDPSTVGDNCLVDALLSGYRPNDIIMDIALNRSESYENRERKHLHNVDDCLPAQPLEGSIRKYTYRTPDYVMGCVQYQDDYPDIPSAWYAHHEQHEWDLTFGTNTMARLFTHHPGIDGNEHGYWTGDLGCKCGSGCGHFFQNRTALVALYDIPPEAPYQMIHAYIPRTYVDEVVEENETIYIREGRVFAALKLLNGYKWSVGGPWSQMEVFSPGGKNGVVCEVGHADDFGDFAAFRQEIASNPIVFDRSSMTLTYQSRRSGQLMIDASGKRVLDGKPVDLEYASYESPYMHSDWDSGKIRIGK